MGTEPYQVTADTGQFSQQNTHPLRFRRNLQPKQFFHCERITEIVGKVGEVVDSIGQRNHLLPAQSLTLLLNPGMEISDFGTGFFDKLAVQLEHDAQHSVGRRMLRSHIQSHAPGRSGFGL